MQEVCGLRGDAKAALRELNISYGGALAAVPTLPCDTAGTTASKAWKRVQSLEWLNPRRFSSRKMWDFRLEMLALVQLLVFLLYMYSRCFYAFGPCKLLAILNFDSVRS